MNFVSSITLMFKDAFSPGFTQAKNSFAGMKQAVSEINANDSMNKMAAELAMVTAMTEPFRQNLSEALDAPSRLAGNFETVMKNIQVLTGKNAGEAAVLRNQLLKMGADAAAGPLGVAAAFNDVAGGITKTEAQIPVLKNALALAEAGQANLGTATNGLVKVMNAYNFTASSAATETEKVAEISERAAWASDVLTQAVGMGMGSMEEFISSMAPVSGLASTVGIGFDEIGSTMAYMTSTTDTAATAGTKLQAFMIALQRPSDSLAAALKKIGITSGSAMLAEYGLAESAQIVSQAFGGNQDAMVQAMGRMEAVKAVLSLTGDTYAGFAQQFGEGMSGITKTAQAIQVEAYESKIARLNAATDALKVQIGGPINSIKGLFVDLGATFLAHVVNPVMSSPIGGAFRGIAAGVGLAAKAALDFGGGALNTATQLTLLTATISNAGGFMKLYGGAIRLLTSPLKVVTSALSRTIGVFITKTWATFTATAAEVGYAGALQLVPGPLRGITKALIKTIAPLLIKTGALSSATAAEAGYAASVKLSANPLAGIASALAKTIGVLVAKTGALAGATAAQISYTASMWAGAAATWAALWPVLAVIAAVALVAGGVYLLIKNWSSVSAFFVNLWRKVTGAFSAAWNWIKNSLSGVSNWVLVLIAVFFPFIGIPLLLIKNWSAIPSFFSGLWNKVTGVFSAAWNGIKNAFNSLPNWVIGLLTVMFPFIVLPMILIKNWGKIGAVFSSLWVGIKSGVADFIGVLGNLWNSGVSLFISAWGHVSGFFSGIWTGFMEKIAAFGDLAGRAWSAITGGFIAAWGLVSGFFSGIWTGFTEIIMVFGEWAGAAWSFISGGFIAAWSQVSGFFIGLWERLKGIVLGFVDWLGPIADAILAPFRAVGWILDKIGGWTRDQLTDNAANLTVSSTAGGTTTAFTPPAGQSLSSTAQSAPAIPAGPDYTGGMPAGRSMPAAPAYASTNMPAGRPLSNTAQSMPAAPVPSVTAPVYTATALSGADSSPMSFTASNAFGAATSMTAADLPAWSAPSYDREAAASFPEAAASYRPGGEYPERKEAVKEQQNHYSITIQNLTFNNEEFERTMDIVKLIIHAAHTPEEATA
jgi:TP901 family phage tail tape measure protein